ncbi:hypothetical protein STEG23_001683 [Scotinomys teguina]
MSFALDIQEYNHCAECGLDNLQLPIEYYRNGEEMSSEHTELATSPRELSYAIAMFPIIDKDITNTEKPCESKGISGNIETVNSKSGVFHLKTLQVI